MERNDPPDAADLPPQRAADDALRRLEERLDRASNAAERLIAEAAAQAAASQPPRPPPAGWQARESASDAASEAGADLELLALVLKSVRELIPPDLQGRLAEALREVLLAVRALIDWYLERAERQRVAPVQVQDIPIA